MPPKPKGIKVTPIPKKPPARSAKGVNAVGSSSSTTQDATAQGSEDNHTSRGKPKSRSNKGGKSNSPLNPGNQSNSPSPPPAGQSSSHNPTSQGPTLSATQRNPETQTLPHEVDPSAAVENIQASTEAPNDVQTEDQEVIKPETARFIPDPRFCGAFVPEVQKPDPSHTKKSSKPKKGVSSFPTNVESGSDDEPPKKSAKSKLKPEMKIKQELVELPHAHRVSPAAELIQDLKSQAITLMPWFPGAPLAVSTVVDDEEKDKDDPVDRKIKVNQTPSALHDNYFIHSQGASVPWFDAITQLPFPWYECPTLMAKLEELAPVLGIVPSPHELEEQGIKLMDLYPAMLAEAKRRAASRTTLKSAKNEISLPDNQNTKGNKQAKTQIQLDKQNPNHPVSHPLPSPVKIPSDSVSPSVAGETSLAVPDSPTPQPSKPAQPLPSAMKKTGKSKEPKTPGGNVEMKGPPYVEPKRVRFHRVPFVAMHIDKKGGLRKLCRSENKANIIPDPSDVDDRDVDTDEEVFGNNRLDYGVQSKVLPPWVVKIFERYYGFLHTAFNHTLYNIVHRAKASAVHQKAEIRKANTALMDWSKSNFDIQFGHQMFGEHAVVIGEDGELEWARGLPSVSLGKEENDSDDNDDDDSDDTTSSFENDIDTDSQPHLRASRYQKCIQSAVQAFRASMKKTEDRRLAAIIIKDNSFRDTWGDMFRIYQLKPETASDAGPTQQQKDTYPKDIVKSHAAEFLASYQSYKNSTLELPSWVQGMFKEFVRKLRIYAAEDAAQLGDVPENTLPGIVEKFDIGLEEEEIAQREANQVNHVTLGGDGMSEAPNPEFELFEVSSGDYGVEFFNNPDAVELIEMLGIEKIQDQEEFQRAKQTSKKEAIRFETGPDGKPLLDGNNQIIWANPEAHALRSKIRWPYFNTHEVVAHNPILYQQRLRDNHKAKPQDDTHTPILPKVHQALAVANILSRAYLDPQYADAHFSTILADEVGLGKTFVPLMVITLLRYHHDQQARDPQYRPPVMDPYKPGFATKSPESLQQDEVDPKSLRVKFIGDIRMGTNTRTGLCHVMLSNKTIISSHLDEAKKLLGSAYYSVYDYSLCFGSDDKSCADFWRRVDDDLNVKNGGKKSSKSKIRKDVVVLSTYHRLKGDAKLSPRTDSPQSQTAANSMLNSQRTFGVIFGDEIAELRNPDTQLTFPFRRLVEQSALIIGATATPIYTSILDIINIARIMGIPAILRREHGAAPMLVKTLPEDGSLPPADASASSRYSFHDCTVEVGAVVAKYKALSDRGKSIEKRRNKERPTKKESNAISGLQTNAEARELSKATRRPLHEKELEFNLDNDNERQLVEEYELYKKDMKDVITTIRQLLQHSMIRRTHVSTGHDLQPLTSIKPVIPIEIEVEMEQWEKDYLEAARLLLKQNDKQFVVRERRAIKDPHAFQYGYWNPNGQTPSAFKLVAKRIRQRLDAEMHLQPEQRAKFVIYCKWTSLLPFYRMYFARFGVYTSVLHGNMTQDQRAEAVQAFQKAEDHPTDRLGEMISSKECRCYPPMEQSLNCSRVILITDVGSTGITLNRASVIYLMDPSWSFADIRQIIGRINRIGQLKPVEAFLVYIMGTCEDRLRKAIKAKQVTSDDLLLGQRAKEDLDYKHASSGIPQQPQPVSSDKDKKTIIDEYTAKRMAGLKKLFAHEITLTLPQADKKSKSNPRKRKMNKGKKSTDSDEMNIDGIQGDDDSGEESEPIETPKPPKKRRTAVQQSNLSKEFISEDEAEKGEEDVTIHVDPPVTIPVDPPVRSTGNTALVALDLPSDLGLPNSHDILFIKTVLRDFRLKTVHNDESYFVRGRQWPSLDTFRTRKRLIAALDRHRSAYPGSASHPDERKAHQQRLKKEIQIIRDIFESKNPHMIGHHAIALGGALSPNGAVNKRTLSQLPARHYIRFIDTFKGMVDEQVSDNLDAYFAGFKDEEEDSATRFESVEGSETTLDDIIASIEYTISTPVSPQRTLGRLSDINIYSDGVAFEHLRKLLIACHNTKHDENGGLDDGDIAAMGIILQKTYYFPLDRAAPTLFPALMLGKLLSDNAKISGPGLEDISTDILPQDVKDDILTQVTPDTRDLFTEKILEAGFKRAKASVH
ncbi:uncharacterized protein IL334_002993 [Kwoniella shivajii]|uniref:Helicase C-terminal domain-containing protein n=1 Tax=Kwoniella shivajii TaxID=564305 RepID=A0ABZ1CW94_9TREE|nr:hypothetical protein IL334_002993 [Kwoniella shivajii]